MRLQHITYACICVWPYILLWYGMVYGETKSGYQTGKEGRWSRRVHGWLVGWWQLCRRRMKYKINKTHARSRQMRKDPSVPRATGKIVVALAQHHYLLMTMIKVLVTGGG